MLPSKYKIAPSQHKIQASTKDGQIIESSVDIDETLKLISKLELNDQNENESTNINMTKVKKSKKHSN